MELDLGGQFADRAYPILASLVVPRPVALVTTISPEGKVNAAPFSFFNMLGADPPILAVAPGDRDDGTPRTPPGISGLLTNLWSIGWSCEPTSVCFLPRQLGILLDCYDARINPSRYLNLRYMDP